MTQYFSRIFFPLFYFPICYRVDIFCFVKGRHDLIPTRFLLSYLHRTGVHSVICHFSLFFFCYCFALVLCFPPCFCSQHAPYTFCTYGMLHFVSALISPPGWILNGCYDRLSCYFSWLYFDLDKRKKRSKSGRRSRKPGIEERSHGNEYGTTWRLV